MEARSIMGFSTQLRSSRAPMAVCVRSKSQSSDPRRSPARRLSTSSRLRRVMRSRNMVRSP